MPSFLVANAAQRAAALEGWANATYAAEARATERAWPTGIPERHQLTPPEARAFLDEVVAAEGWEPVGIEFYSGDGSAWADIENRVIHVARRNLGPHTILHELVHVVTNHTHHDEWFRGDLLYLARRHLPAWGKSLGAAFRWLGLPVEHQDGPISTITAR